MKKNKINNRIVLIVCMLLLAFVAVACGTDSDGSGTPGNPTAAPTAIATAVPTAPSDPTATPEPTEKPTPAPTKAPLAEAQLDVPFADDLSGTEELYSQTFDDEDWPASGEAIIQKADYVEVNGDMLFFTFQNGAYAKSWAAIAFPFELDFETYQQIEISMDLQTNGKIAHKSVFGFFVTNVESKIPTRAGDGLWITPSSTGKVFFLGQQAPGTEIGKGGWGNLNGFADVSTVTGFVDTLEKITFVVRKDKVTGYITKSDNSQHKLFSVEIGDEEIVIYDGSGTEAFRGPNDGAFMRGTGFKIMSHEAITIIDNIMVKAY